MMDKTLKGVRGLVFQELSLARMDNGDFFLDAHQGYGVLAEELDEGNNEAWRADMALNRLLNAIRTNNPGKVRGATYDVERYAIQAAGEYIQAAVCAAPWASDTSVVLTELPPLLAAVAGQKYHCP